MSIYIEKKVDKTKEKTKKKSVHNERILLRDPHLNNKNFPTCVGVENYPSQFTERGFPCVNVTPPITYPHG